MGPSFAQGAFAEASAPRGYGGQVCWQEGRGGAGEGTRTPDVPLGGLQDEAAMRHSALDLAMNVYMDATLLDVAGAPQALPALALDEDLRADHGSARIG